GDHTETFQPTQLAVDGVQCVKDDTGSANITTGVPGSTIICADNSAGRVAGLWRLPLYYNGAGLLALTFTEVQTGSTAGTLALDFTCMCVGPNETVDATNFPSAVDVDATFSTTTGELKEAATTIVCGGSCTFGENLIWRASLDSTNTA